MFLRSVPHTPEVLDGDERCRPFAWASGYTFTRVTRRERVQARQAAPGKCSRLRATQSECASFILCSLLCSTQQGNRRFHRGSQRSVVSSHRLCCMTVSASFRLAHVYQCITAMLFAVQFLCTHSALVSADLINIVVSPDVDWQVLIASHVSVRKGVSLRMHLLKRSLQNLTPVQTRVT
jgi:hypothetical protein